MDTDRFGDARRRCHTERGDRGHTPGGARGESSGSDDACREDVVGESDVAEYGADVWSIPSTGELGGSVLANVQLQLVSYWVTNELGRAIDIPRNLAKSVTVE